jgi:hypothetical protein
LFVHDERPLSPKKTNTLANVILALEFRSALARWTRDDESLSRDQELALVMGEDTYAPAFFDNQKSKRHGARVFGWSHFTGQLLPTVFLQDDALKGTTVLGHWSARMRLIPSFGHHRYGKNSNEPQDFVHVHRVSSTLLFDGVPLSNPRPTFSQDENMSLRSLAARYSLAFILRVILPRVQQICNDKMALFVSCLARARTLLLRAYGDLLEASKPVEDGNLNKDSVMPLSPPSSDRMGPKKEIDPEPSS